MESDLLGRPYLPHGNSGPRTNTQVFWHVGKRGFCCIYFRKIRPNPKKRKKKGKLTFGQSWHPEARSKKVVKLTL
jgi:hypothetical protein